MKLYVISLVALLSMSFWGYGESIPGEIFFLKGEGSGEKYGPFEYKDGEKIVVGKQAFVINKLATVVKQSDLQAKMERLIIPQMEFRQANIEDVIKYLAKVSIDFDKDSAAGEKGVNFILQLKRPATAAETAPAAAANLPTVTLSLRNIRLMDAVRYITEVTGLKYKIENNAVVIELAK